MLPGGQTLAGDAATVCNSYVIAASPTRRASSRRSAPRRPPAGQRHLLPGVRVPWGVDDDARLGHVRHRELADGQVQRPGARVQVGKGPRLGVGHLVPSPQVGELTAQAGQPADVLFPVRVADVPAVRGAHPGHEVADMRLVLGELAPGGRLGDAAPQRVLVDARHRVPLPEQLLGGVVGHQDVVPAVEQGRRQRVERADDLADGVRHRHARALGTQRRRLGQPVQVFPFRPVQPERAGHRVEHLGAGVDLAALLQPGVPGDADASQQSHFLAPQARRAAAGTGRHAEVTRAEPGPACLQELA